MGDPSGSHSERWNLDVSEHPSGRAVIRHCNQGFGTPGSAEYALVKGKAYTFRLRWGATDPWYTSTPRPDYDWQCLVNDSTAEGVRSGLYGTGAFTVEDPGGLLTGETHGNETDITLGREGRIIVPKMEFFESAWTDHSFSPSLGESGRLGVRVLPPPPEGGYAGLSFKLEAVRETENSGEQHIDWVTVGSDSTPDSRPLAFSSLTFDWDGVPSSSAPQANGRDSFQGLSDSAVRILPAATAGQPVPPPFVTAVAKIVLDSDQTTVCEARKRVCIPQVVKMLYDAGAVTRIKTGLVGTTNGVPVTFIQPVTDAEWETMRTSIPSGAQNLIDYTDANIRFVGDSTAVSAPHKTVRFISQNSNDHGWTQDLSFMNANPNGQAFGDVNTLYNNFPVYPDVMNGTFTLPVTPNEVRLHCIRVAMHESGHMFGLVANNDVLGGEAESHNPVPNGTRIMDNGETVPCEVRFGRAGPWGWHQLNDAYLKFVFPKE